MATIFHLMWKSDWEFFGNAGFYEPASLSTDGYVHAAADRASVAALAERHFPHRDEELVLAVIDEEQVPAPTRLADFGAGKRFVHIHGPVPHAAVVGFESLAWRQGRWRLPEDDAMGAEEKLKALGIELPTPPAPLAAYVGWVRTGNLVTIAGQLPMRDGRLYYAGKLGLEINEPDGRAAAKLCCVNALAQLRAAAGSLDKIVRIVRLDGYVASAPGFTNQPAVLNGASEFLLEVFGDAGRHARAAVGVAELPLGASVEIVMWAEVAD